MPAHGAVNRLALCDPKIADVHKNPVEFLVKLSGFAQLATQRLVWARVVPSAALRVAKVTLWSFIGNNSDFMNGSISTGTTALNRPTKNH